VLLPWYHGLTVPSASAAVAALTGKPPGTFLLRISLSEAGCFTASYVTAAGEVRHTRIAHVAAGGGYMVAGSAAPEPSLATVIAKFASVLIHPLPSTLSDLSARTSVPAAPAPHVVPAPAPAPPPSLVPSKSDEFDVMVSYQWDEQPTVRRIREELSRDGFHVWMDETHMSATYAIDMVNAVSSARAILICGTSKYIASKNCATECNLAFEARDRKAIIVLNLEAGFYPASTRHVLAALAAGRLYCDFTQARTSEDGFARGMTDLRRQLQSYGVAPSHAHAAPAAAAAAPAVVPAAAAAAAAAAPPPPPPPAPPVLAAAPSEYADLPCDPAGAPPPPAAAPEYSDAYGAL